MDGTRTVAWGDLLMERVEKKLVLLFRNVINEVIGGNEAIALGMESGCNTAVSLRNRWMHIAVNFI